MKASVSFKPTLQIITTNSEKAFILASMHFHQQVNLHEYVSRIETRTGERVNYSELTLSGQIIYLCNCKD